MHTVEKTHGVGTRKPPDQREIAHDLFREHLDLDRILRVFQVQYTEPTASADKGENTSDEHVAGAAVPVRNAAVVPTPAKRFGRHGFSAVTVAAIVVTCFSGSEVGNTGQQPPASVVSIE